MIKSITIQKSHKSSREANAVICANNLSYSLPIIYSETPGDDSSIHIGSVEFVEGCLGKFRPDFYPHWTEGHWHRSIKDTGRSVFIKSAVSYKSREAFVDRVFVSQVVKFVDEWRHYVVSGESVCSWWYLGEDDSGCDDDPNGPDLPFTIPFSDWCGSIDIGRLVTGEVALVECHHPYAIGWYGPMDGYSCLQYFEFLKTGWKWLIGLRDSQRCGYA